VKFLNINLVYLKIFIIMKFIFKLGLDTLLF